MHDKKSQHVGNHGGAYTDMEGMRKQFTYIDHDVKTKVAVPTMNPEDAIRGLEDYRRFLVNSLLELPPSLVNERFYDFRLNEGSRFTWNENMIKDKGVPIDTLRDMKVLLQNAMTLGNLI